MTDHRKEALFNYHKENLHLMKKAKGSSCKHQAWEGGYLDHVFECLNIAYTMYEALSKIRFLPFTIDSAFLVLYFHDIEKMYKYGVGKDIDKAQYHNNVLKKRGIAFSKEEQNALKYVHGELDDYSQTKRVMNELAGFCHAVDTISARVWHQDGYK